MARTLSARPRAPARGTPTHVPARTAAATPRKSSGGRSGEAKTKAKSPTDAAVTSTVASAPSRARRSSGRCGRDRDRTAARTTNIVPPLRTVKSVKDDPRPASSSAAAASAETLPLSTAVSADAPRSRTTSRGSVSSTRPPVALRTRTMPTTACPAFTRPKTTLGRIGTSVKALTARVATTTAAAAATCADRPRMLSRNQTDTPAAGHASESVESSGRVCRPSRVAPTYRTVKPSRSSALRAPDPCRPAIPPPRGGAARRSPCLPLIGTVSGMLMKDLRSRSGVLGTDVLRTGRPPPPRRAPGTCGRRRPSRRAPRPRRSWRSRRRRRSRPGRVRSPATPPPRRRRRA